MKIKTNQIKVRWNRNKQKDKADFPYSLPLPLDKKKWGRWFARFKIRRTVANGRLRGVCGAEAELQRAIIMITALNAIYLSSASWGEEARKGKFRENTHNTTTVILQFHHPTTGGDQWIGVGLDSVSKYNTAAHTRWKKTQGMLTARAITTPRREFQLNWIELHGMAWHQMRWDGMDYNWAVDEETP